MLVCVYRGGVGLFFVSFCVLHVLFLERLARVHRSRCMRNRVAASVEGKRTRRAMIGRNECFGRSASLYSPAASVRSACRFFVFRKTVAKGVPGQGYSRCTQGGPTVCRLYSRLRFSMCYSRHLGWHWVESVRTADGRDDRSKRI